MNILDEYVEELPTDQSVLDIFSGEWSSALPSAFELNTSPGSAGLFEDGRVIWAESVFGGFSGYKILELGPLEAGHSYMFEKAGAKKIIAIEANKRAFLKCLCIKEVLDLRNVDFKLGSFMPYLESTNTDFDMVFASGVLYHMKEPIKLLHNISKVTSRLFLWTHYYDHSIIQGREDLSKKFSPLQTIEFESEGYELAVQHYQEALGWAGFCGGGNEESTWLTRDSILKALAKFGFSDIQIEFDQPDHPNGPAFALCAQKL